jgi:hypothetical protein
VARDPKGALVEIRLGSFFLMRGEELDTRGDVVDVLLNVRGDVVPGLRSVLKRNGRKRAAYLSQATVDFPVPVCS